MTKEERKLWYEFLRLLPFKVHRQYVIENYIVDFYCASARIVIELDGSQHYEDTAIEADRERDNFLQEQGLTVLRYTNKQVNQEFDSVCKDIALHLGF